MSILFLCCFYRISSFYNCSIFKTIEDDAKASGLRITSIFHDAINAIRTTFTSEIDDAKASGLRITGIFHNAINAMRTTFTSEIFDSNFESSLNNDITAIKNYKNTVASGIEPATALKTCMASASEDAIEYAASIDATSISADEYIAKQRTAQVATVAQSKSLSSAKSLIAEYNSRCKNVGMSQSDFISAIGQTNSGLSKYLSGLNGANASLGGYIVSLASAKLSTIALQVATMALNAALSVGLAIAIQAAVAWLDDLVHAAKKASEAADENASKSKEKAQAAKEEVQQLDELIAKYKELANSDVRDTSRRNEIRDVQGQIADLVGEQADNLNLVNGKLDEELDKLYEIQKIEAEKTVKSASSAYYDAKDAADKAIGAESYLGLDGYDYVGKIDKEVFDELEGLDKIVGTNIAGKSGLNLSSLGDAGLSSDLLGNADLSTIQGKIDALDLLIEKIENINGYDFANSEFYNGLIEARDHYQSYIDSMSEAAISLRDAVTNVAAYDETLSHMTVNSAESFGEYRQKMIDAVSDNPYITGAVANGDITNSDIEDDVTNYLSTLDEFSDYYNDWAKSFTNNGLAETAEEMSTALKTIFSSGDYFKQFSSSDEGSKQIKNSFDSWVDSLSDKDLKLVYQLSLDEDASTRTLDEWKSLVNDITPEIMKSFTSGDYFKQFSSSDEGSKQIKHSFESWVDSLSDEELTVAYKLSLNEESSSWDLAEWIENVKSTLKSQKGLISFSDLINEESENDDAFSDRVDSYIETVSSLKEALHAYSTGDYENSSITNLIKTFPQLASETDNLDVAIYNLLNQLDTNMLADFNAQFGRLDTEEDRQQLLNYQNAVLSTGKTVGNTWFQIDIDTEVDSMDNLYQAMKESVSATGLTSDSISALEARYRSLDSYDPSKLFERTYNGIHLNASALRDLEAEYEKQKKNEIIYGEDGLEEKKKRYNELTKEIESCNDAAKKSELVQEQSNLKPQIEDLANLASQYEGLTSAYNKWILAQSSGEEGDKYDAIRDNLDDVEELYKQGLVGTNAFRSYVDLLSNQDLSTASPTEVREEYERLKQTIEGTSYSATDFLAEGSDGVLSFLNAVKELNNGWVTEEDGKWTLNFEDDEEVARRLGIDVEFLQSILEKLSEYEWVINLNSIYSDIDLLQTKAEEANEKLKEMGKTDIDFNVNSDNIDDVNSQIESAKGLLNSFRNEDGTININAEGAQEAQLILGALIRQKQLLNEPAIMTVDTSGASEEVTSAIVLLQNLQTEYNNLEVETAIGVDTSETQGKIQNIISELENVPDTVKASLGLDDEDLQNSLQELKNTPIDVDAGVNLSQATLDGVVSKINGLVPSMDVTAHVDSTEVDNYQEKEHDSKGTVKFDVNDDEIVKFQNAPHTAKGKVIWDNDELLVKRNFYANGYITWKSAGTKNGLGKPDGLGGVDGTAHANGTAFANGDWGTKQSGVALGGELGQELVVRNGRFFTIGDDSAEFFQYRKGDIIFNAEQTKEIFEKGKITHGSKRGSTFANGSAYIEGTAFSNGSGMITASGHVITTPTGGGGGSSSSNGSSSNNSSEKEEEPQIIDWIEIAIERIERAIDNLATIATSPFRKLAEKLDATNDELSKMSYELSLQQSAYNRYMQQANSVGLSSDLATKVQNGTIDITEYDSDTADKIKDYQEWYEKALDCKDAILELKESIAELYQSKFDDVATDYENQLSLLEHLTNTYNNGIDDLEARGYLASTKYYEALQKTEAQNIAIRKKELAELTEAMSEAVNSGYIKEGSEAWYDFQNSINEVKEAIQESETAMVEFANSIREVKWGHFDYLQEQISNITEEANFLIDLMENSDLYTDNGQLTETGQATMGLHGQNYNVYMAQADKYAEELKKLNAEIADDPNNTKLLERREELLESQRDAILAAEDEKQAIVDMVREGIELELDALQDLIDKYTESLDSAKDLYDYQKKIKDQTSEIASLQKQIAAYAGDTSEENRATVQKLQVDLSDAMEDLEETQYDHYISEQKKLLDTLYNEYEMILNERLDNVDALLSDMIDSINANSSSISDTLITETEKVGYDLSESIKSIWSNEGDAFSIITKYGESFLTELTSVNTVLNSISAKVGKMIGESDASTDETVSMTEPSTTTDTSSTQPSTPSASTLTRSDKDYYGVALAICNGNYGWGTGNTRKSKLKAKGFDANRIQSIVNQMLQEGYVYSGAWVGRYQGIKSLEPYHYNKYAHGGLVDYTGLAQLDGSPTEPEMVLSPKDTANFIALKDAMRSIADGNSPLADLFGSENGASNILTQLAKIENPLSMSGTTVGDITYQVTIPIDHVQDYNDFMNQMRKDGKFEKMIRAMTVDILAGGSKLSKNKYQW